MRPVLAALAFGTPAVLAAAPARAAGCAAYEAAIAAPPCPRPAVVRRRAVPGTYLFVVEFNSQ